MLMQKTLSTLLLLALARAAALAAPAADPPKPAVTLYDGKAGPTAPTVASWGGGSGQDSAETFLFGGHSMKVTTLDGYQGARITFPTPVSLAGDNRVFQLTLHRGGATLHYDPRTVGLPTFGGQPGGGGFGRGGGRGGFGGGRGGARGGGRGGNGRFGGARRNPDGTPVAEPPLIPDISKLRLQFVLADGRQADVLRPIPTSSDATAGEGWYSVNVPIAALKFSGGGDPLLKSVTVGGDHYGVFFVGRLKLGTTASALAVTLDGPETVAPGQPVTLRVKGDTGLSTLKYDWDLGEDQNNAPAPTGPEATARYFDRGQDHTVTVTVTDVDGLSKPVTVTKTVHVN